MARLWTSGAESGHQQSEGLTAPGAGGVPTFDTAVKRSGAASYKSSANLQYMARSMTGVLDRAYFFRFYVQIPAVPSTANVRILNVIGAVNPLALDITTAGKLRILDSTLTQVALGNATLAGGTWYRIEVKLTVPTVGNGSAEVKVDGIVDIALTSFSTGNGAWSSFRFGWVTGAAVLTALYIDDFALNDDQGSDQNSYPGPGNVYLLVPASDPGTGTSTANWTKPGGSTSNRNTSVDNNPPIYIADSTAAGDAEKMLRNPTNAASQLDLDVTDYTAAGVPSTDIITLVMPVAGVGSSSTTDTSGDFGVLSNPVGSQKAMTTFDNGVASTTATTWPTFYADPVYTPSVTRGTKPRLRLSRAAAARTVMTNFMGLLVETVTPVFGAAALTGTGTLSATGTRTQSGAAALTGASTLSATGTRIRLGAAALTGTGTLSATASSGATVSGAAALTGTGTLSAAAAIVFAGAGAGYIDFTDAGRVAGNGGGVIAQTQEGVIA